MVVRIIRRADGSKPEAEKAPVVKHVEVIRKAKRPLSLREQRVVAEVGKGRKSKAEILRNSGFGKATVDHPNRVFDRPEIVEAIEPILERLKKERDEVLKQMAIKRHTAGYGILSMTLGTLNKDIELLAGRPTTREEYVLPEEEKAHLAELLAMNKKKGT